MIFANLDGPPPFLLLVEQFDDRTSPVQLHGDAALVPLSDPDDGITLKLPVRRIGVIDYPYDLDYFLIPLQAGETIRVLIDSVMVDSGGGLFGFSAELIFLPDLDRVYRIVITDPWGDVGGYVLSIERENVSDAPPGGG
jgi:hypothetical protein